VTARARRDRPVASAVRRRARLVAAALTVSVVGCTGGGTPGGASDLPDEPPADVAFTPSPEDAAAAPPLSADLVDGTSVTGDDLWADRPVVLVFTASWCESCAEVHRQAAVDVAEHDGAVALVAVVPDDDEGAEGYASDLDLGHPVAVGDDALWLDYAVREPPLVALVAPGGRLLRGYPGGPDEGVLAEQLELLVVDTG
jgi:thiol-disulfide isomerase/thioredoxin